jgi:hypothetical protein
MKHASQEDLVLLHYGELAHAESVREHVAACGRCREKQAALERFLGALEPAPAPERDAGYEDRLFARVMARLAPPARPAGSYWLAWPRLTAAAAAVILACFAFWIGREQGRHEVALSVEQRERILLLAVSEHLERSERMLRELVNTRPAASLDLGERPRAAERLAADNRLYRATARHAGQEHLALLLDELERVLVEIANSPATVNGAEFNALWRRIQANGLLIKVRIAESETRRAVRQRSPSPSGEI